MATRFSGLVTILGSLLLCSTLRAESHGPVRSTDRAASDHAASDHAASDRAASDRAANDRAASDGPAVALASPSTAVASSNASPSSTASCAVSGTAVPDLDVQMSDAAGRPLARFGGVAVPLTLSAFPERNDGRVRAATNGLGRLRVEGYVPVRAIPIYLKQDVTVVAGHIKILTGTVVEFMGLSGSQMRIAAKTADSLDETYNVTVSCDALTLDPQPKSERKWSAPGHARGYLMKQPVLTLFDQPGSDAKPVASLHLSAQSRGLLFFGDRREGEFIHVLYHHDVAIDGWIVARDLEILPRGELVDQSVSRLLAPKDKKLTVRVEGQLQRAPGDLALYGKADPKLPPIGAVAKDTELYVLDVVVGWASVLPKQLDVVPIGDRQFWVRANELGL